MSNLQSEEKHDLRYKSIRELVWGFGFFILGGLGGDGFITGLAFVLGTISFCFHLYYNWKL